MSPRFSLLMPTRDRPQWIVHAVEAILAQDFEDWELLVKDGGRNPVGGILPQDARIRYEHAPESLSRFNAAVVEARGEILNFCADDDLLRPGALRLVSESIGDRMWLYGQIRFSGSGNVMGAPWNYETLKVVNFVPCPAAFWRAKATAEIGLFDCGVISGDWDYWLRLGARWEPAYLPRVLVDYREHDQQDTILRAGPLLADAEKIRQRAAEGYYAV